MQINPKPLLITAVFAFGFIIGSYKIILIDTLEQYFANTKNQDTAKFDPTLADQHYSDRVMLFQIRNPKTNIVMLGDSITEGGDFRQLSGQNDIINRGIGWDTSSGALKRLDLLGKDTKKCFILIGINDISRDISVDTIYENYKNIINSLLAKNIKPIIQSTLYTVDRAEFNNRKVEELNKKLQEYARQNNITYIDLNNVLSKNKMLKREYTLDGIHLNTQGYITWIATIKPYMD